MPSSDHRLDASRQADDLPAWARRRSQPRDPKTGFLKPRLCELYRAGHTVHYLQAIRSTAQPDRFGLLVEVDDNMFTLDYGDEFRTYRNHEVERLVEIVGMGRGVYVCERYVTLRQYRYSGYCFSIADADEPWVPCDPAPLMSTTPEALAERLNTHGGFSVPGRLLRSWSKDL